MRTLAGKARLPEFDFESASNALALMAQLAHKAIHLEALDATVDVLGRRFCSNRSLAELLAASAKTHPPYAERIRAAQAEVLAQAETAMALSLSGNPTSAVKNLLLHGKESLNARLIDNAWQMLQKHAAKISDAAGAGRDGDGAAPAVRHRGDAAHRWANKNARRVAWR